MEIGECALGRLFTDLKSFFDGFLWPLHASLVFKKHSFEKCGVEFSSYVGGVRDFVSSSNAEHLGSSSEEILARLVGISRNWLLPLDEASLNGDKLFLTINRKHAFQYVLSRILSTDTVYGQRPCRNLAIFLSHANCPSSPLSEYRLQILTRIARRLVECAGYSATEREQDADLRILFTTKTPTGPGIVHCGFIFDTACNRMQITVHDYLKLRERDMRALSEHKYWAAGHEGTIKALAEASLIMDLINVKSESIIKLATDARTIKREESSSGATFILYNYSRLTAIENRFADLVASGTHPPLPNFHDIDVNLLNQREEWVLLFDFLLEYPNLLNRIVANINEGKIDHHLLCLYLTTFANSISSYYNRCRILRDPKLHLLPIIFARLTFIQAIKKVLHHALEILQIPKVNKM